VQPDKHHRLATRVKPNWISDGEGKEGDEFLWNQICGDLVRVSGDSAEEPSPSRDKIAARFSMAERNQVCGGYNAISQQLQEAWSG